MHPTLPDMNTSALDQLTATFTRHYRYRHLSAFANWDQAAMMPPKGNDARAAALAELEILLHQTLADPALAPIFDRADKEADNEESRAGLREMRRHWLMTQQVPQDLVRQQSLASSRCEHAWRTQRLRNDWKGFAENFHEVVKLAREEAALLAQANGLSPYDALMDKFEPGMRSSTLDALFDEVNAWLPRLIRQVTQQQRGESVVAAVGPFAVDRQHALGVDVMRLLGFDLEAGRLDVSTHPFCGGVPEDIRITTRYRDDEFVSSLMSVVHETGHARYEQGLPRHMVHLPVGRARSMGIHESQSLSFERQLARGPAFLALIAPLLKRHFGDQPAFDPANLARMFTRVCPGLIRVDADELTYPAHVILRYQIERALISGDIEVDDIPALWDEKMMASLGLDTRGNFEDGCMQDIHWPSGIFGYFPSYTLGAMYASQYFAAIQRQHPGVERRVAAGDLSDVFNWLDTHVWSQASRWPTDELVQRATGEPLNAGHFRRHLEARYLAN
jgi:carboxypeptidase Taq